MKSRSLRPCIIGVCWETSDESDPLSDLPSRAIGSCRSKEINLKKPQPLTAAIIAYMKTGKERVDVFRVMSLIY